MRRSSEWHPVAAIVIGLVVMIALVAGVAACSSAGGGSAGGGSSEGYCADLAELVGVLDEGGTVAQYNALLGKIVDESPEGHRETWSLMLTLSQEPFTYENFNPAVDALERLDLEDTCPRLPRFVVDDSGRVRRY